MANQDKKILLLKTAEILFAKSGIAETKMEEIASELQMSKKTLYQFFRSKNELVEAVYEGKIQHLNNELNNVVRGEEEPIEKLVSYIHEITSCLEHITPQILEYLRLNNERMVNQVNNYMKVNAYDRIKSLLIELRDNELLRKGVTIESHLLLYRNHIFNFLRNRFLTRGTNLSPSGVFRQSLITLFRGILENDALARFDTLLNKSSEFKQLHISGE